MDVGMLRDHLILAREHVARSEEVVRHQQELVEVLQRDGHDSRMALELLVEFQKTLELYRDDLARLQKELDRQQQR